MTITPKEKLIVALDVPDLKSAQKLVDDLGDQAVFYKIGLELMMSGCYFDLIKWLKSQNKKIFADLKLYDISATVARSVANLAKHDVDLLTIHTASRDIMSQAAQNKGNMQIIGVTALTNLDQNDMLEMGFDPTLSLEELVMKKTELALDSGLDGIVSSALEAPSLRQKFGDDFLIVSPGIRLKNIADDDQKRVADVQTALQNGSSQLVVGRPITRDTDPKSAAAEFNQLIAKYS